MRHTKPIATRWMSGLRVATIPEALLVCARDLPLLDMVVLGDSALHLGLASLDELYLSANRRRWGAAALTHAIGWMDGRSESPWESVLRVFHRACGVPVVPQHPLYDEAGRFIARGDLWIRDSHTLHEYDGAGHRDAATHAEDLRRDRAVPAIGWQRRGYVSADIAGRPQAILRDADRAMGRLHRVDRLDPWLRIWAESLFSASGQDAFRRRMRLEPGPPPWIVGNPDSDMGQQSA